MPRNYENENKWQREKYKQLLFKVKPEEADRYKAHLAKHNIKPTDWLRYAMSLELVPGKAEDDIMDRIIRLLGVTVANAGIAGGTLAEHVMKSLGVYGNDTDISNVEHVLNDIAVSPVVNDGAVADTDISNVGHVSNDATVRPVVVDGADADTDISIKCARCGMLSCGYVDGYFRCGECEFLNYETVPVAEFDAHAAVAPVSDGPSLCSMAPVAAFIDDAHKEVDVTVTDTVLVKMPGEGLPKKNKIMPSPTPELVAEWCRLRRQGLKYSQIAKDTGYEVSTVRKRVNKYESADLQ